MFGANLVIPAQTCDELSHAQAKFPWILSQNVQNDLEDQSQWPIFSIPGKSIKGCMFAETLVIPAQICDELSRGQAEFLRILSKNAQNDFEDQRQWPLSLIPAMIVSHDACLLQIWWF